MTPTAAYRQLNALLWANRLPKASIAFVSDGAMPSGYGITMHENPAALPVILLNSKYKRWGKTLVHEMIHVAEPTLSHGKLFDTLVESYWRRAKKELKGRKTR